MTCIEQAGRCIVENKCVFGLSVTLNMKLIRHMHSLSCSGLVKDLYSPYRKLMSVCVLPTDERNDLP